ncbi:putative orfan [Tupanvirus soda lake]|uniref:Orfan n=2 Tax=Tupanvirus TaxID=2094720 RepID=A0AC62AAT8_9VIRU|nr:putative orfan [Tupanvirus soda lake]QKU34854.1 putative orfan [Tupanvirus soda lake]
MCRCTCPIPRKPLVCGKNTYIRYPNKMPYTGWHVRHEYPSYLSYVANGSYAGRNRRAPC